MTENRVLVFRSLSSIQEDDSQSWPDQRQWLKGVVQALQAARSQKKSYKSVIADFLAGRREVRYHIQPDPDAWSKLQAQWDEVTELLTTRPDLVKHYAHHEGITDDDADEMLLMYRKGWKHIQSTKKPKKPDAVAECLSAPVLQLICDMMDALALFQEPMPPDDLRRLLQDMPIRPIRATSNARVAFFFGKLSEAGQFPRNWQTLFTRHGGLLSSSDGHPMTRQNLGMPWSRNRDLDFGEWSHMKSIVNAISSVAAQSRKDC